MESHEAFPCLSSIPEIVTSTSSMTGPIQRSCMSFSTPSGPGSDPVPFFSTDSFSGGSSSSLSEPLNLNSFGSRSYLNDSRPSLPPLRVNINGLDSWPSQHHSSHPSGLNPSVTSSHHQLPPLTTCSNVSSYSRSTSNSFNDSNPQSQSHPSYPSLLSLPSQVLLSASSLSAPSSPNPTPPSPSPQDLKTRKLAQFLSLVFEAIAARLPLSSLTTLPPTPMSSTSSPNALHDPPTFSNSSNPSYPLKGPDAFSSPYPGLNPSSFSTSSSNSSSSSSSSSSPLSSLGRLPSIDLPATPPPSPPPPHYFLQNRNPSPPSPLIPNSPMTLSQKHNLFVCIYRILKIGNLSLSVVLLGLKFIDRVLRSHPEIKVTSGAESRLFTVSMILSQKISADSPFTNKTFEKITKIPLKELNVLEMEFLRQCDYHLLVGDKEYADWLSFVKMIAIRDLRQSSSSPSNSPPSSSSSSSCTSNSPTSGYEPLSGHPTWGVNLGSPLSPGEGSGLKANSMVYRGQGKAKDSFGGVESLVAKIIQ